MYLIYLIFVAHALSAAAFSDKSDKSVSLLFPFFLGNHISHRLEGFSRLRL